MWDANIVVLLKTSMDLGVIKYLEYCCYGITLKTCKYRCEHKWYFSKGGSNIVEGKSVFILVATPQHMA